MKPLNQIHEAVAELYEFDFLQPSRKREIVNARRMFSVIARDEKYKYVDIQKFLNAAAHSAIVFYVKTHLNLYRTDRDYNTKFRTIQAILMEYE